MGGIVKTQLAIEFAHRYGQFFHGVHWLNAALDFNGEAMALQPWPDKTPEQMDENATFLWTLRVCS